MRTWIPLISLSLALALVVPVRADDSKKDDAKKPAQDTKKDDTKKTDKPAAPKKDGDNKDESAEKPAKKERLYNVRSFVGKLVAVDAQAKKLVLGVPLSHLGGDLLHPRLDTQLENIDVYLSDDVTVRRKYPPPAVDERGRPKRYTRKELRELKGPNKKSWGYTADTDDLKKDVVVQVYVGQHKPPTHEGKLNKKDLASADNRPLAFSIRILVEPYQR